MMKNLNLYNHYVESLESRAYGGLYIHHINQQIYILDFTHRLLGVWDVPLGQSINWKNF